MPLQVVLVIVKKSRPLENRLYQVYGEGIEKLVYGKSLAKAFWTAENKARAEKLLVKDGFLRNALRKKKIALPFETLLSQELNEVKASRVARHIVSERRPAAENIPDPDPIRFAGNLRLRGLALSGGGIRSATFNLGVLQGLAERNVLKSFDYLSTVSGGGYIGSWLISWMQRVGSVTAISTLLNAKKSADPMSEDVRPIRWLRMHSNYLAPTTGILSIDSLTMGLTWLRNTLINQILLVLILCTALSAVGLMFELWNYPYVFVQTYTESYPWIFSVVILGLGALLTGAGMRTYENQDLRGRFGSSKKLPASLVAWAMASGLVVSACLKNLPELKEWPSWSFTNVFFAVSVTGLLFMLGVAWWGNYHKTILKEKQFSFFTALIVYSALASVCSTLLLVCCAKIIAQFPDTFLGDRYARNKYAFVFGPPLVLECLSCGVILRMLLLGKLFADERREWWGRMGAVIHRFILIWIMVTFGALLMPQIVKEFYYNKLPQLPAILGGWGIIIGWAVRKAFNPGSPSANKAKSGFSLSEIFVRFAPYLFMIGFFLIGASALVGIQKIFNIVPHGELSQCILFLLMTICLGGLSWFLGSRIGVNEFSLHHFYRNRLVRAYLGATRRRSSRESTVNSFTGFDRRDDIPMADFKVSKGYRGPYPILNSAMNASSVSELDRQDRKAESFIFSPLYCGFDFSSNRSAGNTSNGIFQYGYRPTEKYGQAGGPTLGTAMAISGAAVNPNMGYHTSAPTAFLLTMFNVRLGRWIGNPRLQQWENSDPGSGLAYLLYDMGAKSDIDKDYVCLSDGGHFDNMGIYELIRRRCHYVLLCDVEEDVNASCEGLANAIRRCRIDFGVEIDINLEPLTLIDEKTGRVEAQSVTGTIHYPGDQKPSGTIVYLKSSILSTQSVDVRQYYLANGSFPQQSTGDQFFDEAQFESYRKLGYDAIMRASL
ncbi:patatin-like phospholipase family protein [Pedobacter endophyticus]|uniref:Patatin-like phospholipase family protein n=2 Tax=Pedobacter endophyticus TaxID=2789740 RepID=A0A7S9L3G3_9SPHI|nr:patatin-like phospholipase family protein [Pedobacter endophyticus]